MTDDNSRLRELSNYSRRPFLELLDRWIEAAPSLDQVRAFAAQYPDRYAAALKQIGGLSGFTTDTVEIGGELRIGKMSDSQLDTWIKQEIERQGYARAITADAAVAEEIPATAAPDPETDQ